MSYQRKYLLNLNHIDTDYEEDAVTRYLDELGIDVNLVGYRYLYELIHLRLKCPDYNCSQLCKALIADKYPKSNVTTIYRGCDYAIYKSLKNQITTSKLIKNAVVIINSKEVLNESRDSQQQAAGC